MSSPKIIIWGKDDFNVLGLFRQLGNQGFDIVFMSHGGSGGCATKSRLCQKVVVINSLLEGKQYLLNNRSDNKPPTVIICSDDEIAEYLDEIQQELWPCYIVPGAKTPGRIAQVTDKCYMTQLAQESGFLVPKSIEFHANRPLDDCFYPCLLKPSHQIKGKYNEFKTRVCKSKRSLAFTQKLLRSEGKYILQEYIPIENVSLVYGCVLKSSEVVIAGVLEKDRFADNGDGSHGVLKPELPNYIERHKIEKFLRSIGYYGLFSIEFGVCYDKAYFFEINLRNDGTSHYFYQAGANIPLAWVKDAIGEAPFVISTNVKQTSYFIDELADKENIKSGKISKHRWEQERAEATVFKYYDAEDMEPYRMMKKGHAKKMLMGRLLSKYRLYIVWIMDRIGIKRK